MERVLKIIRDEMFGGVSSDMDIEVWLDSFFDTNGIVYIDTKTCRFRVNTDNNTYSYKGYGRYDVYTDSISYED